MSQRGFTWVLLWASSVYPSPSSSAHHCAASPSPAPALVLARPPSPSLSPGPAVSPVPSFSPLPPPGPHPPPSSHRCCRSLSPLISEHLCHHSDSVTVDKTKCIIKNYHHCFTENQLDSLWFRGNVSQVMFQFCLTLNIYETMQLFTYELHDLPYWSPSVFPATSFYSAAHHLSTAGCGSEDCWLNVAFLCWLVLWQKMKDRHSQRTVTMWFGFESFSGMVCSYDNMIQIT